MIKFSKKFAIIIPLLGFFTTQNSFAGNYEVKFKLQCTLSKDSIKTRHILSGELLSTKNFNTCPSHGCFDQANIIVFPRKSVEITEYLKDRESGKKIFPGTKRIEMINSETNNNEPNVLFSEHYWGSFNYDEINYLFHKRGFLGSGLNATIYSNNGGQNYHGTISDLSPSVDDQGRNVSISFIYKAECHQIL